jgi:hypothetical protein
MQTIISKASQKEFNKRDVLLVDEQASISVTLWAQQVELFTFRKYLCEINFYRRKNLMVHQIQLWLLRELKLVILMVDSKEI